MLAPGVQIAPSVLTSIAPISDALVLTSTPMPNVPIPSEQKQAVAVSSLATSLESDSHVDQVCIVYMYIYWPYTN